MKISAKLAPIFEYSLIEQFWKDADELGYHGVWNYDHLYGLGSNNVEFEKPTLEGWTTLSAMAVLVKRSRIGCMVSAVTFRNPLLLAKMAVTVDHISNGRLEFGIGAAWHESESVGLGIPFPKPGVRVSMLDEALTMTKLFWSGSKPTFKGKFWSMNEAICSPLPVQRPHPPIVIGGMQPRMLRLIAKHADEWNVPGADAETFSRLSKQLDENCAEIGRDPSEITRGVQLFVHPDVEGQAEQQIAMIPSFEDVGVQHVVMSFYQPPSKALLEQCAPK
ncbi:MAG: LLM class flavin-dependent oxidoreductase [Actinomycetota bacterium]